MPIGMDGTAGELHPNPTLVTICHKHQGNTTLSHSICDAELPERPFHGRVISPELQ